MRGEAAEFEDQPKSVSGNDHHVCVCMYLELYVCVRVGACVDVWCLHVCVHLSVSMYV